MKSNKTINVLSVVVILGFIAGLIHSIYFKIMTEYYLPYTVHSLAMFSLRYFNTWILVSLFLTTVFLLIKIAWNWAWNLLFKNAPIGTVKDKIKLYVSIFLGFTIGCFFFFYGGWWINHYLLPSKFHPLSLLCDIGIFLFSIFLGWVIINSIRENKYKDLIFKCHKITAIVLCLILTGLNSYVFIHIKETQKTPNVIFILIDALRADHLSSYGYPRETSPYIDSIAREGVLFSNAISSAPWTTPSVMSIFTSVYPSVHGVVRVALELGVLSDDFTTLAERLLKNDYETAGIISNPWLDKNWKLNQGFKTYEMVDWNDARKVTSKALSWLDKRPANPFFLSWLYSKSSIPFFLYLHYMDVHAPYDSIPSPYNELFLENKDIISNRKLTEEEIKKIPGYWGLRDIKKTDLNFYITRYDQEIRFVDAEIKKLMDNFDRLGLLNNTIIVITSDHGVEFLEHGGWDMGKNLHDENLHIPLIIKLPSKLPHTHIIDNQVRSIDIMPTLLGILDIPAPNNINGENLTPLIYQKGQLNLDAFSEAMDSDPFNYIKSLRTERFKMIYDTNTKNAWLYDLETDPKESVNLTQNDMYNNQFERVFNLLNANIKINSNLKKHYKEHQTVELHEDMKEDLKSLGYIQ